MPFSQATITSGPHVLPMSGQVLVSWTSSSPFGTTFQLYADGRLAYAGTARQVALGPSYAKALLQVGTVLATERFADQAAALPVAGTGRRPRLAWEGGTYLDPLIAGFRIYCSDGPGLPVDYAAPVATLPAYPGGVIQDGFGQGRFGHGGFGLASSDYTWQDPQTRPDGAWSYAIVPFDTGGAVGPATVVTRAVAGPPRAPGRDPLGLRLTYVYDTGTGLVTLNWLPPES